MKIAIIGSTAYKNRIFRHMFNLKSEGHEVKIPAFDEHPELDELGICKYNRSIIEWADEVHVFWDQRSMGTVFDFGMAFMARKEIKIIYLEPKTFANVMRKYEKEQKKSA